MSIEFTNPLEWPLEWPRTKAENRKTSAYKVRFESAYRYLMNELEHISDNKIAYITSDMRINAKKVPFADQSKNIDPGIAVYFEYKKEKFVLACDKWKTSRENMRALTLTISALRQLERTGVSELLNKAMTGFKQLPSNIENQKAPWYLVLEVGQHATFEEVERAYKRMRQISHPDKGGNKHWFIGVEEAWREFKSR